MENQDEIDKEINMVMIKAISKMITPKGRGWNERREAMLVLIIIKDRRYII